MLKVFCAGWKTAPFSVNSSSSVFYLIDHISPVEQAAGHVLALSRVAHNHLVTGLKTGLGDLCKPIRDQYSGHVTRVDQ